MPNRIIREGINSSPRVNSLSSGAETLYRRLMSACDDYGRFYAGISAIRGACWPTHPSPPCEQDVSKWLAECTQLAPNCSTPLITRYVVAGCMYIQLTDFNQKIRSKSKFPTPVDTLPATCQQLVDNSPALDVVRSSYCEGVCEVRHPHQGEPANGHGPKLDPREEFPEILAEIRKHDAAADDHFARRLMQTVVQSSLSNPKFPPGMLSSVTDSNVARCVAESYRTGPKNHGTGLLLSRVPNIVFTWSLE